MLQCLCALAGRKQPHLTQFLQCWPSVALMRVQAQVHMQCHPKTRSGLPRKQQCHSSHVRNRLVLAGGGTAAWRGREARPSLSLSKETPRRAKGKVRKGEGLALSPHQPRPIHTPRVHNKPVFSFNPQPSQPTEKPRSRVPFWTSFLNRETSSRGGCPSVLARSLDPYPCPQSHP